MWRASVVWSLVAAEFVRWPNVLAVNTETLTTLIESSDLDGLVRFVDGLVASRDWDGIKVMRDRCREAVERGKQVWGPA